MDEKRYKKITSNDLELKMLLERVSDSYDDFVVGAMLLSKDYNRRRKLIDFIKAYPELKTDAILEFLMDTD